MTFINNANNTPLNFKGTQKVALDNLSDNDKTKLAAKSAVNYLKENIERTVPENGEFSKRAAAVAFKIEGTQNFAKLSVEHSPTNPKNERVVLLSVFRQGSDKLFSNYILDGTKKDIVEYFKNDKLSEQVYETAQGLSDKVDKHYF